MRGNKEKNQTRFYVFYAMAVHAALCIAYAGDLLTLFIFYEVLTFSTYPLVTHKQNEMAQKAGRLYMSILVGTSVVLLLPAIIWVCALITFIASIEKFFSIEASEGILEQLVISRFPLYLIILVKVFCYWVSVGLPLIIIFPIIALFLEININVIGTICLSLIIGTISFAFVGILGAGLVLGAKKSNYIVMLLIIPLTIPILIFGISTTNFALNDLPTEATIYLQCMALSFLIAVVPVITSKAIKIYVE